MVEDRDLVESFQVSKYWYYLLTEMLHAESTSQVLCSTLLSYKKLLTELNVEALKKQTVRRQLVDNRVSN